MQSWGNFTVHGTAELEEQIRRLVSDVASVVDRCVMPSEYRAFVLLGGYGRGEGGVEFRNGVALPHNNLDFLLITRGVGRAKQKSLRERVDTALEPIRRGRQVGVDFSTIDAHKLNRSPCLVMWYDMRFGHRTVLGDEQFVPSLDQFVVDGIPDWNVLDLLVNRGTLLVINDLLSEQVVSSSETSRAMWRHLMKAVIGYGDAKLFFANEYDWSYAEKARRMESCGDASELLRENYREAINFRFQPDYERLEAHDLASWTEELRQLFNGVHLQCEQLRLRKPELDWETHVHESLKSSLWADLHSPRAAARKTFNLWNGPRCQVAGSRLASLGGRLAGMRGLLRILFPVVAYQLNSTSLRETAASVLGARDTSIRELRRCYLQQWGVFGDDNFASFLSRHSVSLECMEPVA